MLSTTESMRFSVQTITPAQASAWLGNNVANRRLDKGAVSAMAADMKAGAWRLTHQAIMLGAGGTLIDGQHRLHAVCAADVPVRMAVCRTDEIGTALNYPIDVGRKRHISDVIGARSSDTAVASFIARVVAGRTPSSSEIKWVLSLTNGAIARMSPVKTRIFSQAAVRAAVCLLITESPENEDYVLSQYRALVTADFCNMEVATAALYRRCSKNYNVVSTDMYLRALRALDKRHKDTQRSAIKDKAVRWEETRSRTAGVFPLPL